MVTAKAKKDSEEKEQEAVADITEHDSKEERKGYHVEHCGVHFFIVRGPISDDDFMKRPDEFIHIEVGWWIQVMSSYLLQMRVEARLAEQL